MLADILALLPELLLALGAVCLFGLRSHLIAQDLDTRVTWLSALALTGLGLWVLVNGQVNGQGARPLIDGLLVDDALSRMSQGFVLLAAGVALGLGAEGGPRSLTRDPLALALFLLATLGLLVSCGAENLLSLFFGLQLFVLSTCGLIAQRETSGKAVAAGLRTALAAFVGTALLVFGVALAAAATGATGYADLAARVTDPPGALVSAGLALLIAGLAFILAVAPFHLWLPPAVEATPWPVVALMLGAAPLALLCALARLVFVAFGDIAALWQPVLAAFGLVSVLAGTLAAWVTERLSHLLAAFATIGAGFGLMALSAATLAGGTALLAFMGLQGAALLGLVAFISRLEKEGRAVDLLRDLNGYAATQMSRAFAVLLILLSAAAMPPLAGFVVRLNILQAMHDSGLIWQSMVGVAAMIGAGFAFLRPARRLYLSAETGDAETRAARFPDIVLGGAAAVAVLGLFSLGGLEAAVETAAARLAR